MHLKQYQSQLLDDYAAYLEACRTLESPQRAFEEETRKRFGIALPYRPLAVRNSNLDAEATPFVCLRVPTGGGKTFIAAHAIDRVCRHYLPSDYSVTLWLVPTDPIRQQTINVLRDPSSPIRRSVRDVLGNFQVVEISEAIRLPNTDYDNGHVIIVCTMAAFKRGDTESLNVYKENGDLMTHFSGIPDAAAKGEHSFADVLRLRRPFIIVDEAHNQGTPLALDTLSHLRPSSILELTATPDRANNPSNVLQSISASTLQAEDMLKLPLELAVHENWQVVLRDALARRDQLEKDAIEEAKLTGEHIRPVLLIQAEKTFQDKETMNPERVKAELLANFGVDETDIAIVTGKLDELGNRRIGDADFPRIIITVDKLREGWDCPVAYVLMTFRETTSSTAIEQVVGRVLRMPNVRRKRTERLNRSYAYACSTTFATVLQSLRDGLVANGFERMETRDLVSIPEQDEAPIFSGSVETVINLPQENGRLIVPDMDTFTQAEKKQIEVTPESGRMVITGEVKPSLRKKLIAAMPGQAAKDHISKELEQIPATFALERRQPTPSEQGERWHIPQLVWKQDDFIEILDIDVLLEGDWQLASFDPVLTESEFPNEPEAMQRARLTVSQAEKVIGTPYERMEAQLASVLAESGWDLMSLTSWLDRNIFFPYVSQADKIAWLRRVLEELVQKRNLPIEELAYRKYRLRKAIEDKLKAGLRLVRQQTLAELLDTDGTLALETGDNSTCFQQGRYAYDYAYNGFYQFRKHFFPNIGNLQAQGEEFECAQWLDRCPAVKWWVRNVEKKKGAFWIPTSRYNFYPDFITQLHDGRTLVVEYKGADRRELASEQEKDDLGKYWASLGKGKALFIMVSARNFSEIAKAIETPA